MLDISPNNSYLESETVQTVQSSIYGRPIDYLKNNSNFEKNFSSKIQDLRLNHGASNLSGGHINASRHVSRGYANDYVLSNGPRKMTSTDLLPLSRSDVHEKDIDPISLKNSLKMSTLLKVQEVSGEDECTPSITDKQFFPSRPRQVWEQKPAAAEEKLSEQDVERMKAEKRRQIEEEMMRELNQASTDRIREACEEEEDEDETLKAPVTESKKLEEKISKAGEYRCIVIPIKNSLFNDTPSVEFRGSEVNGGQDIQKDFEGSIDRRRDTEDDGELNLKSGNLGVFWTWDGDVEKSGEIDSGKMKTHDNIFDKDLDRQVAVIGNSFSEMWTEEPEMHLPTLKTSDRLLRPTYERIKQAGRRHAEGALKHEFLEASPSIIYHGDGNVNDLDFRATMNSDLNIIEEL